LGHSQSQGLGGSSDGGLKPRLLVVTFFKNRDIFVDIYRALSYLASYPDLQAAFGSDTAAATWHYVTYGYHEGRYISTFVLMGTSTDETLTGGSGNEILYGLNGNDTLNGGAGVDLLIGGDGDDTFVFSNASDIGITAGSRDVISDFISGQDQIDLSGIDANSGIDGNQSFSGTILGGSGVFSSAGQLHYDSAEGVLYGNTDNDAEAEFAIQLLGVVMLNTADLLL
jgi:Ca2+-binding RTX toxin-like protein